MKILTSTVVDGKIELPAGALADGERVTVLAWSADEPVVLTASQEAEIAQAVEDIRRGDSVDGDELIAELRTAAAG